MSEVFSTPYGHFSPGGREYTITRPDTPRPWINVLSNGDYGLAISQAGGGYAWRSHAGVSRVTRWNQDLVRDADGRFLYLRDEASGEFWSLAWQPVKPDFTSFECRHGMGYTCFITRFQGIEATWTISVAPDSPLEIWQVRLRELENRARRVSLFSYLEWLLGAAPDWHREFHRSFIETLYDPGSGTILANKYNWEPPVPESAHWNIDWPYTAFHCAWPRPAAFETDKQAFLGRYGSPSSPQALITGQLAGTAGRWGDAIASLQVALDLPAGGEAEAVFTLGAAGDRAQALELAERFTIGPAASQAAEGTRRYWNALVERLQVETPDPGLNVMTNGWLVYQAISCRLWGRSAYYQTGGAFGFRDQLQDSLVYLLLGQPDRTLSQIRLHARHQFADGGAQHWWHPLPSLGEAREIESGVRNKISDNRLWLAFVLARYVEETGDLSAFDLVEPFADDPSPASLWEHCRRAFELSLGTLSEHGLPRIGGGDWNDGLNAVGVEGLGESVWLGHFLHGLLNDFSGFAHSRGEGSQAQRYRQAAEGLRQAVNTHAWDGSWYWRASTDAGKRLGSHQNQDGKIFLNSQTWAILGNTAPPERAQKAWEAVETWLLKDFGPLLLAPAYHTPDPTIGYLTRYAPGERENGGVYTHAATWALLAACRLGRNETAYKIYQKLCPPNHSADIERYRGEPYVTPGNVDGPDSPNYGRGGWTWYTGSAQWLLRATLEGLFGLRPTLEGLHITPCLPPGWESCRVNRFFRGSVYEIEYRRDPGGEPRLVLDGTVVKGPLLPLPSAPAHQVIVYFK